MRVKCRCGSTVFTVQVPKKRGKRLALVCSSCKKIWPISVDFSPPKDECRCGSRLFFVHTPPQHTATRNKIVYLICNECRALQEIKYGELAEVDAYGVLKEAL